MGIGGEEYRHANSQNDFKHYESITIRQQLALIDERTRPTHLTRCNYADLGDRMHGLSSHGPTPPLTARLGGLPDY